MNATDTARPASDKQLSFIDNLIQEKLNEQQRSDTYKRLSDGITSREASVWIDRLVAMPTINGKPASDKQLVFIGKLVDERLAGDERDEAMAKIDRREFTGGREGTASAFIDQLMAMPKLAKGARSANLPEVPKGRYAIENADGVLTFYHVGVRQGEVVIDVKAGPNTHEIPFTEKGYTTILQAILDAGVKAATVRYGHELGCCGVCGRDLTDETSRAAGIGPVCAQRF